MFQLMATTFSIVNLHEPLGVEVLLQAPALGFLSSVKKLAL